MEIPVKTIAPNTLHICSAAEALALLRKHGGHGSAAFMRSLADAVSDENNHITGTVGDFNNLIDRFEALGDYFDALRVCDFALKIYPRSATLLAITLNTCARSGADGETYLAAAESLGRENWNEPRLFKDAAEYCRTRALCCPPEQNSEHMGYFSYRLALAKTALVIESDYRNKADIEEALTCCQRAFDLVTFQSYADDLKRCYVQLCENPQNPIDLKTHRLVKHVLNTAETASAPTQN